MDERLILCSACGEVRPKSELRAVGSSYGCRGQPECLRFLRKQLKEQKQAHTKKRAELFRLGGR